MPLVTNLKHHAKPLTTDVTNNSRPPLAWLSKPFSCQRLPAQAEACRAIWATLTSESLPCTYGGTLFPVLLESCLDEACRTLQGRLVQSMRLSHFRCLHHITIWVCPNKISRSQKPALTRRPNCCGGASSLTASAMTQKSEMSCKFLHPLTPRPWNFFLPWKFHTA